MIFYKKLLKREDLEAILHFLSFNKKFVLVAKEAGLNILKHTSYGIFKFYKIKDGYKMVFEDFTGKLDIKKAFLKGYSSTKTLGIGLNLVINLVDEMTIIPKKNGKIFEFVFYENEKKEYCVFEKEFDDVVAILKTSPFLSITTSGDCGVFEKVKDKYFFSLWDIAGHGSSEEYKYSKEFKKLLLAFRYFDLKDVVEVVNYLFNRDVACVIGEIKTKIHFFHFGDIRFIYDKLYMLESEFLGNALRFKEFEFKKNDIVFFSDGIDLKEKVLSFTEISRALRDKKRDDASILAIRFKNGTDL